jgi:acyl-CoA reductase-like NAD-dependent aldehyde dehydrogenase
MASDERVRVEIGFDGGQIMGALVSADSADQLEQAVASGSEGSLRLQADDGGYSVAVARIVYVKRFTREARLGFSGS